MPATLSIFMIAGEMAATGGPHSPARFFVFFLLFYACYFFRRRHAWRYVAGCVLVALSPLLYDRDAVSEGYVSELIVLCTAYVTLGWLIISGKGILVDPARAGAPAVAARPAHRPAEPARDAGVARLAAWRAARRSG